MSAIDSLTEDEIDRIADAVVKKLLPLLEQLSKGSGGFLTKDNVGPIVTDECEQQADDSVRNITGFNQSLYE